MQRIEMLDRGRVEAVFLQRLDQPFDSGGNHETAPRRHPALRHFKRRGVIEAMLEERGADRQLVEVRKERNLGGVEPKIYRHSEYLPLTGTRCDDAPLARR